MVSESPEILTDDEWREETFTEEQLNSARIQDLQFGASTFKQLKDALAKFGPEGILESAINLPRKQYEELAKLVRKAPSASTPRRRRRR